MQDEHNPVFRRVATDGRRLEVAKLRDLERHTQETSAPTLRNTMKRSSNAARINSHFSRQFIEINQSVSDQVAVRYTVCYKYELQALGAGEVFHARAANL